MDLVEIFEKAADELTIRGKCVGALIEDVSVVVDGLLTTRFVSGGKVCTLGALCLANGYSENQLFECDDYDESLPGAIEFGRFLIEKKFINAKPLDSNPDFEVVIRFNDSNEDED